MNEFGESLIVARSRRVRERVANNREVTLLQGIIHWTQSDDGEIDLRSEPKASIQLRERDGDRAVVVSLRLCRDRDSGASDEPEKRQKQVVLALAISRIFAAEQMDR